MADFDTAEFTAWLRASCERQGVPVTVTDPAVIAQVVTLAGARGPQPRRRTGARSRGHVAS